MNPLLTVLVIFFAHILSEIRGQTCPTQDISPCKCAEDAYRRATVDCSSASSSAEISSALTNTSLPPSQLWRFYIQNNAAVLELTEGTFQRLTFEFIQIYGSAVKNIHPLALVPLQGRLEVFVISHCPLEDFPFYDLSEFHRLKELHLFNNLLTSVPAFMSKSLEILFLHNNKIMSVEFDRWATPNLKVLQLHNNLLTSIPAIRSDSLELLSLNDNKITSLKFDEWATPNLKQLFLSNISLTSVPAFKSDSIENLILCTNKFTSVKFEEWATPRLKVLKLCNMSLTHVPALKSDSIESLDLGYNKITSVEFDGWATPRLKQLLVNDNLLISVPAFRSDTLEILRLNNNNITSVEFDGWATPNLRVFDIVKNIHPLALVPLQGRLEVFVISHCPLEDFPFYNLSEFHRLKELHLFNNLLTSVPAFMSKSLEILFLHNNKIMSVEFDRWTTPNLKVLQLHNNLLTSIPAIRSDSLELLSLNDNKITSLEFDEWATPNLKQLFLSNISLTSVPAFKSDSIENLTLCTNKFTSVKFEEWATPRYFHEFETLYSNWCSHLKLPTRWGRLKQLLVNDNLLISVPAFRSDTLEILRLNNNNITSVEFDGWATPNLRVFDIGNNPLLKFPSGIVDGMTKLEEFWCQGGTLGPTLSSGFLEFHSKALKLVVLQNNGISRVEPGAIKGLRHDTKVLLGENKIDVLSEGSFRPMLAILSIGDGVLDLSGNPIPCDCEMWWLVLARKLLRHVSGKCHNGTELRDVDSGNNPLLKFPSGIVDGMTKLEEFWCQGGTLGPTLSSGFLEFHSKALKLVVLQNNGISRVEPGAIKGLRHDTKVLLDENKIDVLSEESFRPMLAILSIGDGVLDLSGNPIPCDCEMSTEHERAFNDAVQRPFTVLPCLNSLHLSPRKLRTVALTGMVTQNGSWSSLCEPGTVTLSHVGDCRSGELCCQPNVQNTTTMTSALNTFFVCGRKNYRTTSSNGGKPSEIEEWPWQAAIYDVKAQDFVCGGALIQEQWVLTAAHCVRPGIPFLSDPKTDFVVHLGKHHRADTEDDEYVQIRQVSHIFQHKDYSKENYDSDIALLKLAKPSVLTERVQLICLPTKYDVSDENLQDGMLGWVAGWGNDGSDLQTAVLTEVQLPVISNRLCRRDTTNFTGDFTATRTLTSNMFCAGHSTNTSLEDYRTVCPGDSGSPMVFLSNASHDSYWTVEGIVSHFFQKETCNLRRPGQYGVFTRVNRFTRWINEVLPDF
ncbi:unnamed protein product [Darwinula stevensoni]|uniref:Peptidase S1 domain-containing protein n=1 Tax=Darwinula stevensoni TaxID=69355 RepID=A0A7R8X0U9_9CRUS|nr:unnamed protein product [Darwinula stevensoni]CAG0879251.1 unnamed protein product [Darwinula stevensoni]